VDVRDLEAYVAVVDHGGFRRAADALFVSQSSLTRRVARLEQDLGVTLLERGPHGLRMTGHGEVLLSGARRVMGALDEVRDAAVGTWRDSIRLGCTATAAGSYLTEFLSRWIPDHPATRVTMVEDGAQGLRRRLEERECDAAVVASPVPSGFQSLPVTRARVLAVLPPGHRLAGTGGPLRVDELDREPVLVNGPSFLATELLMSACRVASVEPEVVYECSVGQTLAALAEAGLGVAVISDTVDRRGFSLPTRPLCDRDGGLLTFELRVAWLRERPLPPVVREFVTSLSEFTRPLRARPRDAG
jgi:DNA-binding transcriptional LysR family regulator